MTWDLMTGKSISTLRGGGGGGPRDLATLIAWAPAGGGLALVSHVQPIRGWNPTTDSCVSELKGNRGRVT
jgi:WD40 repeat protein